MHYTHMESPVGRLLLAGDEAGLRIISFPTGSHRRQVEPGWRRDPAPLRPVIAQLEAATLLLRDGYAPARTVYFSFGHDEEVGGKDGAKEVAGEKVFG